jgi:hypothetical protein
MTQMNGYKSKMSRWATRRKTGRKRPGKGPGRPTHADRLMLFSPRFMIPFDLAPPWFICRSCLLQPLHPIILLTSIHQKAAAARWGRELDEFVVRINTDRRNEARGGLQVVVLGVFPSFSATIFIDDVLRRLHHPYVLQSLIPRVRWIHDM